MSKSLLFAVVLLSSSGASWSQADAARTERLKKAHANQPAANDESQQRRAALRAALGKAREQKADNTDDASKTRRQLTDQERQVLRQQLRQQRNDAPQP